MSNTTPTPTPENPARPYYYKWDDSLLGYVVLKHGDASFIGMQFNYEAFAAEAVRKRNDAHEAAAKAKRDADRAPALEAEVARLRKALEWYYERHSAGSSFYDPYDECVSAMGEARETLAKLAALAKAESTTRPEERASDGNPDASLWCTDHETGKDYFIKTGKLLALHAEAMDMVKAGKDAWTKPSLEART